MDGKKELQDIDVFIDLENVLLQNETGYSFLKIESLLNGIKLGLKDEGLIPKKIFGSSSTSKRVVEQGEKLSVQRIFKKHGATMRWVGGNADRALMREIESDVKNGKLCKVVLLLTNDKHFIEAVRLLKAQGISVWVAGRSVSKVLSQEADRVINLPEFLASQQIIDDYSRGGSELLNPFPL